VLLGFVEQAKKEAEKLAQRLQDSRERVKELEAKQGSREFP